MAQQCFGNQPEHTSIIEVCPAHINTSTAVLLKKLKTDINLHVGQLLSIAYEKLTGRLPPQGTLNMWATSVRGFNWNRHTYSK